MGAIATITTFAGSIAAGTGATIIAESAVLDIGSRYASTKLGKFCVTMCAMTVGGAAYEKVSDMFTEQALEFWELVDKVKEIRSESKNKPEKEPLDRDAVMEEAVNKLNLTAESLGKSLDGNEEK